VDWIEACGSHGCVIEDANLHIFPIVSEYIAYSFSRTNIVLYICHDYVY
jgi:hypothetical protein